MNRYSPCQSDLLTKMHRPGADNHASIGLSFNSLPFTRVIR
ncbi:hypothetical protein YPPY66_0650 [Yersinia pestis PY-66]|nr:hypothetical protein YPPY06_0541 [Yersinia pestis PY-06]EIR83604.1 hypothetical protein YPPY32_0761 [Yersinia pestis PY-32]EIR96657.1 hypothetical protein YPPY42_0556 [Yersinia pestis PY-42]EIS36207.1 hypothetical protein YPPY54_0543 [Yersinia pestis PY-54]EIS49833.1 hypothetical protein YPPY58_0545 [Yersinia pestis PY-58]EIS50446.1 hypothetical protein YPPY59_0570 [Yersinia pestis PY-59]EIS86018.1 hypothetical protein YPPY66_0650 [Yersinia pestis PY-66]EIS92088.1 hypothetical protein YPP